jgi:hypothetical protein
MGDSAAFRARTGFSPEDFAGLKPEAYAGTINTGSYILI